MIAASLIAPAGAAASRGCVCCDAPTVPPLGSCPAHHLGAHYNDSETPHDDLTLVDLAPAVIEEEDPEPETDWYVFRPNDELRYAGCGEAALTYDAPYVPGASVGPDSPIKWAGSLKLRSWDGGIFLKGTTSLGSVTFRAYRHHPDGSAPFFSVEAIVGTDDPIGLTRPCHLVGQECYVSLLVRQVWFQVYVYATISDGTRSESHVLIPQGVTMCPTTDLIDDADDPPEPAEVQGGPYMPAACKTDTPPTIGEFCDDDGCTDEIICKITPSVTSAPPGYSAAITGWPSVVVDDGIGQPQTGTLVITDTNPIFICNYPSVTLTLSCVGGVTHLAASGGAIVSGLSVSCDPYTVNATVTVPNIPSTPCPSQSFGVRFVGSEEGCPEGEPTKGRFDDVCLLQTGICKGFVWDLLNCACRPKEAGEAGTFPIPGGGFFGGGNECPEICPGDVPAVPGAWGLICPTTAKVRHQSRCTDVANPPPGIDRSTNYRWDGEYVLMRPGMIPFPYCGESPCYWCLSRSSPGCHFSSGLLFAKELSDRLDCEVDFELRLGNWDLYVGKTGARAIATHVTTPNVIDPTSCVYIVLAEYVATWLPCDDLTGGSWVMTLDYQATLEHYWTQLTLSTDPRTDVPTWLELPAWPASVTLLAL